MPQTKWTRVARQDLKEIGLYIGRTERRPSTAAKILREIKSKCDEYAIAFAQGSVIGSDASHLDPDCRVFSYKRWVIILVCLLSRSSKDSPRARTA